MANKRKRWMALLSALVIVLGTLTGCQNGGDTAPSQTEVPVGVAPGQPLATAYAADRVFSLNYSSESSLNPITTSSSTSLPRKAKDCPLSFIINANKRAAKP